MNLIVCVLSAFMVAAIAVIWKRSLALSWRSVDEGATRVSWMVIWIYTAAHTVVIERRSDPAALLNTGLSLQNLIQVVCGIGVIAWALRVVASNKVRLRALTEGSGFWVTLLVIVYGVSAAWSMWPVYTLYRACELAAFWVLARHVFSGTDWVKSMMKYVAGVIIMTAISGVWTLIQQPSEVFPGMLGLLYSNPGSALAAVLVLLGLHEASLRHNSRSVALPLCGLLTLVLFGSFAATLILPLAILVFLVCRAPRFLRASLVMTLGALLIAILPYAIEAGPDPPRILGEFAGLYGKQPEHVSSLSGRLNLWSALWEATRLHPFGMGFAAGERLFVVTSNQFYNLNWSATNAHSGFMSAWMGAGWVGLGVLAGLIFSLGTRVRALPSGARPLGWSLLVLLLMSNATVVGIGGPYNPLFMVAMALGCGPLGHSRSTTEENVVRPGARGLLGSEA